MPLFFSSSRLSAAPNNVSHYDDESYDEKDVDEATQRERYQEAQEPQDKQNAGDGEKHGDLLS
jgi:hypothetical protein